MLYKTKNGQLTGFVPGVGEIVNGTIESPIKLEGNFVEVTQPQTPVVPVAPVVSPTLPTAHPIQPDIQSVQNTNNSAEVTNG